MRVKGSEMETMALQFLKEKGFVLLCRNFHCRQGEIDLIGIIQNCLIFVEVRFRKSVAFGFPSETISVRKQRKIMHCAQYFLQKAPQYKNLSCRFDVIAITLSKDFKIEWIKDAFRLHEYS